MDSSGGTHSSGGSGGGNEADGGVINSSSGGNSGGGSGSSSGGGGDGVDATSPPADAGPVGPQCPSDPSTCVDCCGQLDPAGYQAFLNALAPCLCGDGGAGFVCAPSCANEVCVGSPYASQDDSCEECVNKNGGRPSVCFSEARSSCTGDGTCTDFMNCYMGCPPGAQ